MPPIHYIFVLSMNNSGTTVLCQYPAAQAQAYQAGRARREAWERHGGRPEL